MKNQFKLFFMFILLLCLSVSLYSDLWLESTKAELNAGDHHGTYAINGNGTDGDLQLATTIYNSRFDEDGGSYDGWIDTSFGDGIITNSIVNAAGRTSVSYNYATYSGGPSWAKQSQILNHELDNLNRFHLEVYPISSQCSGTYSLKLRVDAFDEDDNSLLDTDEPYDVIEYILYGNATAGTTFDWYNQVTADSWNYMTWNLKNHIQYFLISPNTWDDVAYVKINFESYSGYTGGSTCGSYWDAFWAASFIDDDFDDNYITPSKWIEHDRGTDGSQIYIAEQNQELRFHGTSHLSYWYWTYVKTQELITHADHRYTESSIQVRLPNFNAVNSVFTFFFESDDGQDHFRLLVQPNNGYKYGWRENGIWYDSGQWFPFLGIEDETFISWRIIYDSVLNVAYGLINGTFIGMHGIDLGDYRIKICYDIEYAGAYTDIRIEDFTFIKFDDGEFETKYLDEAIFVSDRHDTGYEVPYGAHFDQVSWDHDDESVEFQIRSAENHIDVLYADWYGPESNPTGWYENPGEINSTHHNDRWLQYRTRLSTTDQTITPSLHYVSLTYNDAVGIIFELDNPQLTGGGDNFEFDIMAYATDSGTKHGDLMVLLNYNSLGFGENIIANGNADVTKGTLLDGDVPGMPGVPLYTLQSSDHSSSCFQSRIEFSSIALPFSGNDLPATPAQLLHVVIQIQDEEQYSGLSFPESEMQNDQFQSDLQTNYTPVIAVDTDNSQLTCTPQNLLIFIFDENVYLVWTEVPGATSYNVYSTSDPSDDLPWFLEESGILDTHWFEPVTDVIKFYYITAECD